MANEIRKQLHLVDRTAEPVAFSRPRRRRCRPGARTGDQHAVKPTCGLRYLAEFGVLLTAAPEATPFKLQRSRRYLLARSGPANFPNKSRHWHHGLRPARSHLLLTGPTHGRLRAQQRRNLRRS